MSVAVDTSTTGLWIEQRGKGPDVLLIAGLGDPVEAWEAQLAGLSDSHRLTAFDNRGAGRSPLPDGALTVAGMADDAAAVLRERAAAPAHVAGFSLGSLIAQELALRHPDLVRSLVLIGTWGRIDAYTRATVAAWRWMIEAAPSERAFLEAFFVWIYTPRAHASGWVDQVIEETLAFAHPPSREAIQVTIDMLLAHETLDRLPAITVPALVLAGELDRVCPPRLGREVADGIPGARFEVLAGQAHQPFQEVPDEINARLDAFWRDVETMS